MRKKRCPHCRITKSIDMFYRNRNTADGRSVWCGQCKRIESYNRRRKDPEMAKIIHRRSAYKHRDKRRAYSREYRKVNHDELIAYTAEYRRTHPEEIAIRNAAQYNANIEQRREYRKLYRALKPEIGRANDRKRRARARGVKECFGSKESAFVRAHWNNECAICGKTRDEEGRTLAIDHWYPLSKGYALTIKNAVLMCHSCNARKGDQYPISRFDYQTINRIEQALDMQNSAWEKMQLCSLLTN